MNKLPTDKDYKELIKKIQDSSHHNTFWFQGVGYEGEVLAMLVHYRLDLMVDWLVRGPFIKLVGARVWGQFGRMDNVLCMHIESESGYDYDIKGNWSSEHPFIDFTLQLFWEESFIRSEYPSEDAKDYVKGDFLRTSRNSKDMIPNTSEGYILLADKIIEIDNS
jgi:hypothetical protein